MNPSKIVSVFESMPAPAGEANVRPTHAFPCGHSSRRKKTCFADAQLRQIVIDEQHFRHENSDWTSSPLCKRPAAAGCPEFTNYALCSWL